MSFQILNKEGQALTMNELDKDAAYVFGCEVHPKSYASPISKPSGHAPEDIRALRMWMQANWFDFLGWKIHYSKHNSFDLLRQEVNKPFIEEGLSLVQIMEDVQWGAYNRLISYWESKGYTPRGFDE